jgi:Ca2+-binding RTX toxin-like protein
LDANDYVVYNNTTGALLYDADGSGATAAIQIATIGVGLGMTNTDIVVI